MALVPVGPQSPDSPTCLSRTCLRLTRWPRPLQGLRASLGRLHGCRPHSVVPAASTLPASPSVAARWTDRHMRAGGDSACRGPCAQCVPAHAAAGNLVCWRNFTDVSICFVYFLVKSKENWPLVRLTASRSLMNNGVRARRRGERCRDPTVPSRHESSVPGAWPGPASRVWKAGCSHYELASWRQLLSP